MKKLSKATRVGERGMTLIEIMVVVVIIGIIASVVGVSVFNSLDEAKRRVAATQIKQVGDALDLYKLSIGSYPSTAEGLTALTSPKNGEKPFMNSVPKDPWDNNFVYVYPGSHNTGGFDLMSYGPDGVQGGTDDIGNWDKSSGK